MSRYGKTDGALFAIPLVACFHEFDGIMANGLLDPRTARYKHDSSTIGSPIMCAIDALCFIARIVVSPFMFKLSLSQTLDLTIRGRYKNEAGDGDEEGRELGEGGGIQSLEKQTWLRWLFFLVGTLGPAIKLALTQGLPWTKAWGMMFLLPWVTFECMALMNQTKPENCESPLQDADLRTRLAIQKFESIDDFCFSTGIALYIILILWVILDIWSLRAFHYPKRDATPFNYFGKHIISPIAGLAAVGLLYIFAGTLFFALLLTVGATMESDWSSPKSSMISACKILIWILIGSAGVMIFFVIFVKDWGDMEKAAFLVEAPIMACVLSAVPLLKRVIGWLCGRYDGLGEMLLVRGVEEEGSGRRKWLSGLNGLVFFLVNLVVCVWWYWLRFDSKGTVDPGWTGIFG